MSPLYVSHVGKSDVTLVTYTPPTNMPKAGHLVIQSTVPIVNIKPIPRVPKKTCCVVQISLVFMPAEGRQR